MTMRPILYYALFSPPSRACVITAKVIKLDLDLKLVDFSKKEHLTDKFIKINPQHTVPVLIDEGESIFDSHVVMTYMVSKYAKDDSLYPKDLLKRARVDQRMYFENGVLFQVLKDFVNRIIYGGETEYNPKSIQLAHTAYEFLEKFLENDFMTGSSMTLADISIHTSLITVQKLVPIDAEKYPKIIAWLERMKSLPDNEEINEKGAELLSLRILSSLEENKAKVKHN